MTQEQINNIEEKAFLAGRLGIRTLVTNGEGFFCIDISIVQTYKDYKNHHQYQEYVDKPYPTDELVLKIKNEYFENLVKTLLK